MIAAPSYEMHFLTPTYRPAGGVVKIFDYLVHALDLGYQAHVHCPIAPGDEDQLFSIPRFASLRDDPRVSFHASDPKTPIRSRISPRTDTSGVMRKCVTSTSLASATIPLPSVV